jgi:hypothetical protein
MILLSLAPQQLQEVTIAQEHQPAFACRCTLRGWPDVVFQNHAEVACVRDLRSQLKSRSFTPQPVTHPVMAVRYQADFDATVYSQMKGDYPFVGGAPGARQ